MSDHVTMSLRPIGRISSAFPDSRAAPRQSRLAPRSEGLVRIDPPYRAGLEDLAAFGFVWVIAWLDQPHDPLEDPFRVQPLLRPHKGEVSLFATRCPIRANPIAMTLAELVALDAPKGELHLRGIDLADGTPVLDLKPYVPAFDRPQGGVPVASGWYEDDHLSAPLPLEAARLELLSATEHWRKEGRPFAVIQLLGLRGPGVRSGGELCAATETEVAGELLGGAIGRQHILELARSVLSSGGTRAADLAVDTAWAAEHALGVAPRVAAFAHPGLDVPAEFWHALHSSSPVVLAVTLAGAGRTTVLEAGGERGPLTGRSDVSDAAHELLALSYEARRTVAEHGPEVALETFYPTPRLVIAGWPALGRVIADVARQIGWSCITTPSPEEAAALVSDLTRHDAVVVLGHDSRLDEPVLTAALRPGGPGFVGALGSASVVQNRQRRLVALGVEPSELARLRSPVGLPIGGRTSSEMALAIVAQIQATRYAT
jgi:tRNA-Thr(GGU) m(6)t(6)A37 methyltransferase TsaA